MRLGEFGGRLEGAETGSSLVWGGFGAALARFLNVFAESKAKIKNW